MAWHESWNESPPPARGFFVDRGGMFPPGVKIILILTVAAFVLEMFTGDLLFRYGSLSLAALARLEVWRLVTYMFLHGSSDHLLLNMFVFWMLGMHLERQMGTKAFLAMYFAAGIVGGLSEELFNVAMYARYLPLRPDVAHVFLAMPAVGASAGVMGVLTAFATLNPRVKLLIFFVIPAQAWWVAVGYGLYETWPLAKALLSSSGYDWSDKVAHAAHFGGMVLGFVWIRWGERIRLKWFSGPQRSQGTYLADEPDEEEAELDRILDKIKAQGLDSLTTREKMFLQEVSRRHRGGPGSL